MRRLVYTQLDAAAWPHPGLSPVNRLVAAAILLAVVAAVLETEPEFRDAYPGFFATTDMVFGFLFSAEYLLRLWVAGEDSRYKGLVGRVKYVVSPIALVDFFALLPFFLTAGVDDAFLLRLFRLLRLFGLAKLGRYSSALQNINTALRQRRYELLMSLAAAFVVMFLAASALHFSEGARNPESFGSIPRALWWGVATVTKVGYAGAFPETLVGKFFAAIFAIAGVGVVAIPTGILAASFSDAFQRERDRRTAGTKHD